MRLLYLTSLYPAYLRSFYGRRPDLANAPFAEHRAAFDRDGFAWNGAWKEPMAAAGHEFEEVTVNADSAQRAWAAENGVAVPASGGRQAIVFEQIRAFKPDVILADDVRNFSAAWYRELRRAVPSVQAILGLLTSPSYEEATLRECDVILCLLRTDVDRINSQGGRAYFFRHGFNSLLVPQLVERAADVNGISFCGSIIRGAGCHDARESMLERLADSGLDLEIFTPGAETSWLSDMATTTARRAVYLTVKSVRAVGASYETARAIPFIGKAASWTEFPRSQFNARLRPYMRPAVYGVDLLNTMRRSAVTVNVHGEIAGDEAVNVRLYEATGAGTCLLTDHKSDIATIFAPDTEVVTFKNADECVERAKWLTANPRAREDIAAAGFRRVMRDHTLFHRVSDIEAAVAMVDRGI